MRDFGFIPVLIIIAVIAAIVVFSYVQGQQHAKTLQRLAQRFRGRFEPGSLLMRGQVRLRFQGYPALLKYVQHGKHGTHTVFSITWPEPTFRLEVYPQDILSGFRRLWGMEDIEIGSPDFDRAFYISGNSRQAVRDMLSAEVQAITWKLAQLNPMPGFHDRRDIQVQFLGGVLTITKPRYISSYEDLERFVSLSAELFQAATQTRTTGIEFLSSGSAEPQEPDSVESQCQVCGEPLAKDLVWCAACKTPHHRECWEYFGSCSTYACGHKKHMTKAKRRKVK
jgi:hypothetical protein